MSFLKVGNITISKRAKKELKDLPKDIQKKFKKQMEIFKQNPYYPSLQFKKYHSIKSNLWEIRINSKYRVILEQDIKNNEITADFTIISVGKHDILDKGKF